MAYEKDYGIHFAHLGMLYCLLLVVAGSSTSNAEHISIKPHEAELKQKSATNADLKVTQGLALLKTGKQNELREAHRLFEDAAKEGNPDAEFILGILFMTGQGVSKSDRVAAD